MGTRSAREAFDVLLQRLEPSEIEVANRKSHAKTIEQALKAGFRGFNRIEVIGSHTRATAIAVASDVDYLAVLGRDDVTWGNSLKSSTTVLQNVKGALEARFKATDVWIDGPAVVVGFGQGKGRVDVVPGYYTGTTKIDGYPLFGIPDAAGGWLETSPQRHGKFIIEANEHSGWKLSRTVQLLKCWKYSRDPNTRFLAFHVELLLASEGICVGPKSYGQCLYEAFSLLNGRNGAALNDPLGISPRIPLAYTQAKRDQVVERAASATVHALKALDAENAGKTEEAFRQWDIVFNHEFPSRWT